MPKVLAETESQDYSFDEFASGGSLSQQSSLNLAAEGATSLSRVHNIGLDSKGSLL
jgi:hypothetical protein